MHYSNSTCEGDALARFVTVKKGDDGVYTADGAWPRVQTKALKIDKNEAKQFGHVFASMHRSCDGRAARSKTKNTLLIKFN